MSNKPTIKLSDDESVLHKTLFDALHECFDTVEPPHTIDLLQVWLSSSDENHAETGPLSYATKRSLYEKLYKPCMEWAYENYAPEFFESLKQHFEEQHEQIKEQEGVSPSKLRGGKLTPYFDPLSGAVVNFTNDDGDIVGWFDSNMDFDKMVDWLLGGEYAEDCLLLVQDGATQVSVVSKCGREAKFSILQCLEMEAA